MKSFFLTTVLCVSLSARVFSQSPGGVGTTNLRGWFDASTGVTLTGGVVSGWTDRAGIGNASQTTAGERPGQSTSAINYNTALTFDGANDNLDLADRMLSSVTALSAYAVATQSGTTGDTWGSVFNGQVNGPSWTGGGYGLVALNSGSTLHGFYVRDYNTKGVSFALSNNVTTIISGIWNGTTANAVQAYKSGTSAGTVAYTPGSVGDGGSTWIGCGDGANTDWCFYGNIAEIAVYNTGLGSGENSRILSYLAVKYGITMAINYVNSASSTIYATSGSYTNNIIGITRDDGSGLTQKQSKTPDDTVRIYLSTLASSNSANGGSFSSNLSHVMVGGTTGKMCNSASSATDVPASSGIIRRLEREWKVTNTNFGGTFSMDFKLNACAVVGSVNTSHLYLLIDDDGNFTSGTNTVVASGTGGITISYSSPVITVSGISTSLIPSGATRFISIGSNNSSTPLPVTLTRFEGSSAGIFNAIQWEAATESMFSHYELESSPDGLSFTKIHSVEARQDGEVNKTYRFSDYNFYEPVTYYRLRMVDLDGTSETSNIIAVSGGNKKTQIRLYPNPALSFINIVVSDINESKIVAEVTNLIGEKLMIKEFNLSRDVTGHELNLNLSNLRPGSYVVMLKNMQNDILAKEKFLKAE